MAPPPKRGPVNGSPGTTRIVLIRAIGPPTHAAMSMAELRDGCAEAGLENARTLLATGNLLFETSASASRARASVRDVLSRHGLDNALFMRRPDELAAVLEANPFPDAALKRPNHLLVLFLERRVGESELRELEAYDGPERFEARGRELYIDYVDGVGRSRLTPAVLERRLGQPGTARNWNTVNKLVEAAS